MIFFSVLYNPGFNALKNIMFAKQSGFKPVVYLNKVTDDFLKILEYYGAVILGNNINVGLGPAFYELEMYLHKIGERHYIYFDQDTVTDESVWKLILETYAEKVANLDAGLVFYGNNVLENSNLVVSSGCLFLMDILDKIGMHDKNYFVEGVDYEFCLRLKINGLKIYNVYSEFIDHKSLQPNKLINIFGVKIYIRVYGERRLKDFNRSHKKLLLKSLAAGEYPMFFSFLKSLICFNIHEKFSRSLSRFL